MICYIKSKFIHLRFTYIYRILKIIAVGYKEHNACEGAAFEEGGIVVNSSLKQKGFASLRTLFVHLKNTF